MIKVTVLKPAEPVRWTVVFHRKAENWLFGLIALGRFKHVSAFAWVPECVVWLHYDVGFRRTRITVLPDTEESKAYLARLITGNAIVTMPVRDDAVPLLRFGLFCTTAVKHLIGLGGGALRPDALFASCLRHGGELSDDASQENRSAGRPQPRAGTTAGAATAD
jgi:hypothetical protein